jgi:hypothetical protein
MALFVPLAHAVDAERAQKLGRERRRVMPRIPSRRGLGVAVGLGTLFLLFLSGGVHSQPQEPAGRPGPARFYPLDLQALANQKRKADFHQNNLPGNNLDALTSGEHRLLGIPFQVGQGVLQLGSQLLPDKPEKIDGIKVGKKFTTLHILHATAYSVDEEEVTIGNYILHYEDGTTQTIPIVNGKDVRGWWKRPLAPEPSHGKVAWEGANDYVKGMGASIRLFMSTWKNPEPGTAVVSVDYASTMTKCAPFCVAITVAEPLKPRAVAGPVTTGDLEQLWKQLASDGNQASDAIETLAGVPMQAIPFLSARLRAVQPAAVEKRVAMLITQLDDDNFSVREKATKELETLGPEAFSQLRRSLDEPISVEVRHRIDCLVEKLKTAKLTADQNRLQGALLVFELIATAEARQVLEEVATGSAGAWLAPEAQASLKRLEKRKD